MNLHVHKTRPCVLFAAMLFSFVCSGIVRAELPDYPMTPGEMKILAGYFTADGKYLGGLPEFHGLSREIYECTDLQYSEANNTASNASFCAAWSADESYGGGFQLGTCECKFPASNNEYCSDWICDQGSSDFVFCQCDDDIDSSANSLFCNSWSCKQISSGGRAEYESYVCQRPSLSGYYCEAWNGNVSASDEFEVVACECMANWDGEQVCSFWECEELGISTCSSMGKSWCNLGVSVGVGGGFGLCGILVICFGLCGIFSVCVEPTFTKSKGLCFVFVGALWCLLWAVGVVIWGGQDGATFVGIMWGLPILVTVAALCFTVFTRRLKDEQ